MRVLPDVGLSTVAGLPLTLTAASVLCQLIYEELTSTPAVESEGKEHELWRISLKSVDNKEALHLSLRQAKPFKRQYNNFMFTNVKKFISR